MDLPGIADQHLKYRICHVGGALNLIVEGALWLLSAAFGAAGIIPAAILILLFGGMFIHLLATGLSRLLRLPRATTANCLPVLSTWVALTVPLGLPLIFMATAGGRENLLFPAFAVLVGAHFLPIAYIYSMRSFLALAGSLVVAGILFGLVWAASFSACGFVSAALLFAFAFLHLFLVRQERETRPADLG